MEVVSQGLENRRRDIEIKPNEYAQAGIAEYWVIDPENQTVTIHELTGNTYDPATYDRDAMAKSTRLPGFAVQVSDVLAAASGPNA